MYSTLHIYKSYRKKGSKCDLYAKFRFTSHTSVCPGRAYACRTLNIDHIFVSLLFGFSCLL
jgi:hypothetical protein